MRLPSTTPQPAAFSAGSMYSALVSASFIDFLEFAGEGLVQQRFPQCLQRVEFALVENSKSLAIFKKTVQCSDDLLLLFRRWDDMVKLALLGDGHLISRGLPHHL